MAEATRERRRPKHPRNWWVEIRKGVGTGESFICEIVKATGPQRVNGTVRVDVFQRMSGEGGIAKVVSIETEAELNGQLTLRVFDAMKNKQLFKVVTNRWGRPRRANERKEDEAEGTNS